MSNPTANHTSQTTYTVTVTDGNSCTATDDIVVSVDVAPGWANFQHASATTICQGATITTYGQIYKSGETDNTTNQEIDNAYLGYSTSNSSVDGVGWTWAAATFYSGSGNNDEFTYDVTLPSSGTYYLAYKYVDGACTVYGGTGGIFNNDGQAITVNALPTVGITVSETSGSSNNDGTVCAGASVTLSGTSASSYSWDNSITDGVSFTANSTTTYTVTGTDGNGCTDTESQIITVDATPTASAGSALSAICQSGTSAAMGGSVGGGATGGTWTGGAGSWTNASDVANATYTASSSESGSITLTLTTSGGSCGTTTDTKNITVQAAPNAGTLSGTEAVCSNGSTTFSSDGDAGTWSSGNTSVANISWSQNLVNNGDNGNTSGWTITADGGNGWGSGTNYTGSTSGAFRGSYGWCKKTQTIDLVAAGFSTGDLDAAPNISFSEWYKGTWQGGSYGSNRGYYCKVSLLNAASSEVTSQTNGSTTS